MKPDVNLCDRCIKLESILILILQSEENRKQLFEKALEVLGGKSAMPKRAPTVG